MIQASLIPRDLQHEMIRLEQGTKKPIDPRWNRQRTPFGLLIAHDGPIGVKIIRPYVVIDVDQQKIPGDIQALQEQAAVVKTPNGWHLWLKAPAEWRISNTKCLGKGRKIDTFAQHKDWPTRQVVAPGSWGQNKKTGETVQYHLLPGRTIDQAGTIGEEWKGVFHKELRAKQKMGGKTLTDKEWETILWTLNPEEYKDRADSWFRISAAFYAATEGRGLNAWLVWALQDPEYNNEESYRKNSMEWEKFAAQPGENAIGPGTLIFESRKARLTKRDDELTRTRRH